MNIKLVILLIHCFLIAISGYTETVYCIATKANIRIAPGATSTLVGTMTFGESAKLLDSFVNISNNENAWYKISFGQNKTGWVSSTLIGKIFYYQPNKWEQSVWGRIFLPVGWVEGKGLVYVGGTSNSMACEGAPRSLQLYNPGKKKNDTLLNDNCPSGGFWQKHQYEVNRILNSFKADTTNVVFSFSKPEKDRLNIKIDINWDPEFHGRMKSFSVRRSSSDSSQVIYSQHEIKWFDSGVKYLGYLTSTAANDTVVVLGLSESDDDGIKLINLNP